MNDNNIIYLNKYIDPSIQTGGNQIGGKFSIFDRSCNTSTSRTFYKIFNSYLDAHLEGGSITIVSDKSKLPIEYNMKKLKDKFSEHINKFPQYVDIRKLVITPDSTYIGIDRKTTTDDLIKVDMPSYIHYDSESMFSSAQDALNRYNNKHDTSFTLKKHTQTGGQNDLTALNVERCLAHKFNEAPHKYQELTIMNKDNKIVSLYPQTFTYNNYSDDACILIRNFF